MGTPPPPLLTYAVITDPDPIQTSPQTGDPSLAKLTIIVSNDTHQFIECQSISFGFLQGTDAKDFFSDATGIVPSAPTGWSITQVGSLFTATPDNSPAQIGAAGLVFVLTTIQVNEQPGTTIMTVTEETGSDPKNPITGTKNIPLYKIPLTFKVGKLTAAPPMISAGKYTTLEWSGTSGAIYQIQYHDINGNLVIISNVEGSNTPLPSTGTYTISGIQQNTTFYLVVTLNLPGQNEPLYVLRYFPVTVATPPAIPVGTIVAFAAPLSNVPPGWIYCAGQDVSGAMFPQLVAVLGNTYGTPQTAGNVVVPNYLGMFLRGVDTEGALDFDCQQRESPIAGNPTVVGPLIGSRQSSQLATHMHPVFLGSGTQEQMGGNYNIMITSGDPVQAALSETRPVNAYVYYLIYGGIPQT